MANPEPMQKAGMQFLVHWARVSAGGSRNRRSNPVFIPVPMQSTIQIPPVLLRSLQCHLGGSQWS